MMNVVVLIGRLTKDPELRYTPSGKAVCQFRLAVDRGTSSAQGEKEADFFDVVVWEKQAENCANYLSKGRLVAVNGRLQSRSYDAQDGTRRTVTEVVARDVRFLERKQGGDAPAGGSREGSFGTDVPPSDDDDVPF